MRNLLGGLSPREFLRDHWQKKPLLVRGAFRDFVEPLTRAEVHELATREQAESRVVQGSGARWSLRHGPFARRDWRALNASGAPWTVLVQDTQHHSREAHEILARFGFISTARIDDLMVSYATDGGGVGPHVDSYDVFLLQGMGKRRWRISTQTDLALIENAPLKILKRFKAQQEFVLETGDMLYLPPHVAHHGVAIGECMTWSIGFRAPSFHELFVYYADFLRDELQVAGRYADPDLTATVHTGAAGTHFERALRKSLGRSLQQARDVQLMNRALGRFLTEPKAHVTFEAPDRARSPARFFRAAMRTGVELALATRLLSVAGRFFINGRELETAAADQSAWQQLADTRRLSRETLQRVSAAAAEALAQLYQQGELILNEANG